MSTKQSYNYDEEMEEDVTEYTPADEIIIERREIVGRVRLGNGPKSAITEAFTIAGDYLSEELQPDTEHIQVEFRHGDFLFVARVER